MKKLFSYAMLIMSMFVFAACPSDDDEENSPSSKASSQFVGFWEMEGIKKSGQSRGTNVSLLFYKEGKLRVLGGSSYLNDYEWTYDKDTRILSTTAIVNGCNLQWEITLVSDDSWAGIGLWDATSSPTVANRIDLNSYKGYSKGEYAEMILRERTWQNGGGKSFKVGCSVMHFYLEGTALKKHNSLVDSYGIGTLKSFAEKDYPFSYDKKTDQLSIFFELEVGLRRYNYITIKIDHPFSLKDSRLELSETSDVDFLESGKYKIAD